MAWIPWSTPCGARLHRTWDSREDNSQGTLTHSYTSLGACQKIWKVQRIIIKMDNNYFWYKHSLLHRTDMYSVPSEYTVHPDHPHPPTPIQPPQCPKKKMKVRVVAVLTISFKILESMQPCTILEKKSTKSTLEFQRNFGKHAGKLRGLSSLSSFLGTSLLNKADY